MAKSRIYDDPPTVADGGIVRRNSGEVIHAPREYDASSHASQLYGIPMARKEVDPTTRTYNAQWPGTERYRKWARTYLASTSRVQQGWDTVYQEEIEKRFPKLFDYVAWHAFHHGWNVDQLVKLARTTGDRIIRGESNARILATPGVRDVLHRVGLGPSWYGIPISRRKLRYEEPL